MNAHPLYALLSKLDEAKIHYTLHRTRSDTVMAAITLVGERIEAEVFEDGRVEFSRFRGDESVEVDTSILDAIIEENRD